MNTKEKELLIGIKLSKLNFELSKTEALICAKSYFETSLINHFDNIVIFSLKPKTKKDIFIWLNRLGFAKEAYLISFDDFDTFFDFPTYVTLGGSFRIHNKSKKDIDELAKAIVKKRVGNKANLKDPDLNIYVFDDFIGLKLWENEDDFDSRRAHLKNSPHPTTLNPRISRAMINLASAKKEVLDPFCGSGGILEEAKLLDLNYLGVDISKKMIDRAQINLACSENLFCMDAFAWTKKTECVVTDLPYGQSSFLKGTLNDLTNKFLKHFFNLTNKIVVCLPSNIKLNNKKWLVEHFFDIYVHKSLTRRIYVLKKQEKSNKV